MNVQLPEIKLPTAYVISNLIGQHQRAPPNYAHARLASYTLHNLGRARIEESLVRQIIDYGQASAKIHVLKIFKVISFVLPE